MAVAFQSAISATYQHCWNVMAIMSNTVAHSGAKVEQGRVEQAAVTIWRVLQFLNELGKLLDLLTCYACVLVQALLSVLVMRNIMVRFVNANVGIAAASRFVTGHEAEYAGHVTLVSQMS